MNHDVEEHLRAVLQQHAEEAPPGASMLSAVTAASARQRRIRRLTAVAAAVTALTALTAVTAVTALTLTHTRSPQVVGAPPPSTGPSPAVGTLIPSTAPTAITFPFTPSTAAGYGVPMITIAGGQPSLRQTLPDAASAAVTVFQAQPKPPSTKARATPTTVRGHAATLFDWSYADDDPQLVGPADQRTLVWPESATQWVELRIEPAAVPAATLQAYAETLQARAVSAAVPFTFGLTPAGFTIDNIDPSVVTFCPPGTPLDQGYSGKIAVMLSLTSEPPLGTPVKVGSRGAWLATAPDVKTLQVALGDNRYLVIQQTATTNLSDTEVLRFAAAITVTSAARAGQG